MTSLYNFMCIVYVIVCISLVVIILLQKKRSSGLGNVMSGISNSEQTYWNKNRCRSLEGILEKYTKILGAIFIVLSFLLCLIK